MKLYVVQQPYMNEPAPGTCFSVFRAESEDKLRKALIQQDVTNLGVDRKLATQTVASFLIWKAADDRVRRADTLSAHEVELIEID